MGATRGLRVYVEGEKIKRIICNISDQCGLATYKFAKAANKPKASVSLPLTNFVLGIFITHLHIELFLRSSHVTMPVLRDI